MSLETPLTVLYKEINGSKITTDVYLPKTTSSSPLKYPVGGYYLIRPFRVPAQWDMLNNNLHANLTLIVIDIHGGAFMLGHSKMVSMPQVNDCLERGWIVIVPNHRLCPGVNLLEGPMQDIRDLLAWVYDGHLDVVLAEQGPHRVDMENVAAFGTSSGGHLALSLV